MRVSPLKRSGDLLSDRFPAVKTGLRSNAERRVKPLISFLLNLQLKLEAIDEFGDRADDRGVAALSLTPRY